MPGIYQRMLDHFTGSEPELFNSVFQKKLQDVIKTSYEPEQGHRLSDVDVKEIYNFVARNLAACILLHSRDQDRIGDYTLLDRQQIHSVADTLQKKPAIDEAIAQILKDYAQALFRDQERYESKRKIQIEQEARQLFASLLEVTTEDNINNFGNSFAESDHKSRNNAIFHLNKLQQDGIFDKNLVLDIRKVLKTDAECYLFADFFGKIDLAALTKESSEASNPRLQVQVLWTMGEATVVRDAFYRTVY
ncbi:hypothetical protein N7499_001896 [Penicillium canescens]|nr:hypothetical protein N7499_001896 [Penicillium canescens]KAJ6165512.1 hypothetical protein N7485_008756 [Penicillium canescens]